MEMVGDVAVQICIIQTERDFWLTCGFPCYLDKNDERKQRLVVHVEINEAKYMLKQMK